MFRALRTWGITARLIALAVLPACMMFVLLNVWLYSAGHKQLASQIAERGQLIAQAMAETSQYAVVSGNLDYVERNIRSLVDRDSSIVAIEVFGTDGQLLAAGESGRPVADVSRFEEAISGDVPDVNVFDRGDEPHVVVSRQAPASFRSAKTSGRVRVTMSRATLIAKAQEGLYVGVAVALLVTLLSVGGGLYLARGLSAPLRAVMVALRDIRAGRFEVYLQPRASGELGELQVAIEKMAADLGRTHHHLEDEVAQRTVELQQALEDLHRGNAEKRRLIASSNARLEEERQRISVEIHDQLNASLLALGLQAQHIAGICQQDSAAPNAQAIGGVAAKMNGTIQSLYGTARSLVKQLRPEILDTLGLRGALEEMCNNYDQLHPECRFHLDMEDVPPEEGDLGITVYRLVQEALSNIVKHARATEAKVCVSRCADHVDVRITDNGVGFDVGEKSGDGIGLIGMQERVATVGGNMSIQSSPAGTNVAFELPLHASLPAPADASLRPPASLL